MSFPMALFVTVLLLIGSGFFVAAEFALVAAKRHRMEKAAAEGRRGAKAALAGMRELSLMLASAQLGITVCTLGLGSVSKPAITRSLDRLTELGLAKRGPDPRDRRSVLVQRTRRGTDFLNDVKDLLGTALKETGGRAKRAA